MHAARRTVRSAAAASGSIDAADRSSDSSDEEDADASTDEAPVEEEEKPKVAKSSDFLVRTGAGVVMGGIGGVAVFVGGELYGAAIALVAYQCIAEYYGFLKRMGKGKGKLPLPLRKSASFACVAIVVATQYGIRGGVFEMASCGLIAMLVMLRAEKSRIRFTQLTTLVFGLFYCGYLPSFWVRVRALAAPATITLNDTLQSVVATVSGSVPAPVTVQAGLLCTLLPVLCIVAADTFAYLGGRTYGKTPLIAISPKKTWEGAVCGCAGAMCISLLFNWATGWPGSYVAAAGLGFSVFLASIFGDLVESSMKREANMKDSGTLIPGHGGLLDRFDSYLFTGVIVYFFWYWFYWSTGNPLMPLRPLMQPTGVY